MTDHRLILPDVDHYNISAIVEDYLKFHALPVTIVCYSKPELLDQVLSVIYNRSVSTSIKKHGDLVEISVI
jgi:hypothetical protein